MEAVSAILKQLKTERDRLNVAIVALESMSNGTFRGGRRTMSAAGRARIAAAQRKRWAKVKAKKK